MKKVKVETEVGEKTLLLNKREEEQLELELKGVLHYVKEFLDVNGKIITSDRIIRIINEDL